MSFTSFLLGMFVTSALCGKQHARQSSQSGDGAGENSRHFQMRGDRKRNLP